MIALPYDYLLIVWLVLAIAMPCQVECSRSRWRTGSASFRRWAGFERMRTKD